MNIEKVSDPACTAFITRTLLAQSHQTQINYNLITIHILLPMK